MQLHLQPHSGKHLVYTEELIIDIKAMINYVYLRGKITILAIFCSYLTKLPLIKQQELPTWSN